jgi:conjugative transfer pilus assembly protein TraH
MAILKKIFILIMACSLFLNGAELDKILSNSGSSFDFAGPSGLKTQTRGYYSFGGMSVRHDLGGSVRPFNISMPKIHSGCGGIDMVFGAFSYLGLDMIVEKLQKIASAASAFVFNMALSTLCKDCQQIMSELEAIADTINGLNFDACKSAINWGKAIGGAMNKSLLASDDSIKNIKKTLSNASTKIKEWTSSISATIHCESGSSVGICSSTTEEEKTKAAIESLKFQGSLIRKVFRDDSGFLDAVVNPDDPTSTYSYWLGGLTDQQAEDLFRNMFGDMYGFVNADDCMADDYKEGGGSLPYNVTVVNPRMGANEIVNLFFDGNSSSGYGGDMYGLSLESETNLQAVCGPGMMGRPKYALNHYKLPANVKGRTMHEDVKNRLRTILNDMGAANNKTMENHAKFISQLNYPVYRALNIASITKDELLIDYIADVVITKEVVHLINELMKKARAMSQVATTNETSRAVPESWLFQLEERIAAVEAHAAMKDKETLKNMESRVAQIFVLDDVLNRYKKELVRKGMLRMAK